MPAVAQSLQHPDIRVLSRSMCMWILEWGYTMSSSCEDHLDRSSCPVASASSYLPALLKCPIPHYEDRCGPGMVLVAVCQSCSGRCAAVQYIFFHWLLSAAFFCKSTVSLSMKFCSFLSSRSWQHSSVSSSIHSFDTVPLCKRFVVMISSSMAGVIGEPWGIYTMEYKSIGIRTETTQCF